MACEYEAVQSKPGRPTNKINANVEKAWIEFALTRAIPSSYTRKSTSIDGVLRGIHSEWAYNQLEAAYDGVIDIRVMEKDEATRDMIRILSMRDVSHDRNWHELKIGDDFETSIQK